MKYILKIIIKIIIGTIFAPLLIISGIIAICRVIFTMTFIFVWEHSDKWYSYIFIKLDKLFKSLY